MNFRRHLLNIYEQKTRSYGQQPAPYPCGNWCLPVKDRARALPKFVSSETGHPKAAIIARRACLISASRYLRATAAAPLANICKTFSKVPGKLCQNKREDYESDRKKNENKTPKMSLGTDPIWTENDVARGPPPTATSKRKKNKKTLLLLRLLRYNAWKVEYELTKSLLHI